MTFARRRAFLPLLFGFAAAAFGAAAPTRAQDCLLTITNPPASSQVGSGTAQITLQGTASATVTGTLAWVNTAASASGSVAASTGWTLPNVPLVLGTNVITVSGAGSSPTAPVTNAQDNGSASAYATAWPNGSNGGGGFGAWSLFTTAPSSGNGGFFMAQSQSNLNIGPRAWGLYANSGFLARARRPLAAPLQVGDTLRARMDSNVVDTGGRVAMELLNSAGNGLWHLDFVAGNISYGLSDQATDIAYTSQGLDISFTLLSATSYSVTVIRAGATTHIFTGTLLSNPDSAVAQVQFVNDNAGSDGTRNFYVNDLLVTSNPQGPTTCSDAVTVVRGSTPPTVRINEVMSSNGAAAPDEDGDYSDWIELHNYGAAPVSLLGFGLTDSPGTPFKWIFPDVTLQPGEYRLVWASSKDRRPADQDLGNGLMRQVYTGISGILVSDLTNHPSFPDQPSSQGIITGLFEAPSNIGDDYGQRMFGFVRAPTSGTFRFYIASDDASELYLSTDTDPANAVRVASVPDYTDPRDWTKYLSQRSDPIPLVSNQLYYISAVMKEGGFSDHLAVGWRLPNNSLDRPISGAHLFTRRELHANFNVSAAGESIQLTDPASNVVDLVAVPALPRDISYGRSLSNAAAFVYFGESTPGAANSTPGFAEVLPPPVFSAPAGWYTSSVSVSVSSPSPGAQIRYTLDGSEPTTNSPLLTTLLNFGSRAGTPNTISEIPTNNDPNAGPPFYEGWLPPAGEVFKIHTLRVRVFKSGALPSRPVTQSYLIHPSGAARYSMPVVSIAADAAHFFSDETGIYVPGWYDNMFQTGDAWERPGTVEFFEPNGAPGFNIEVGIRLHGNTTRNRPRKSLRIYARNPTTLTYPLFPDKPVANFDTFILRNGGNDWGNSILRDDFLQSLVAHTDLDRQYSRPAVVFLNGEYWGIHAIRDRYDDGYTEHHYGLGETEFTQLETIYNGSITETVYDRGDPALLADFQNLFQFIDSQGVVATSNYNAVADRLDLADFIDFYTAEIYFGNTDWPGNNIRHWRSVATNRAENAPYRHDGRWRYRLGDTDFGFGLDFFYVPGVSDFAQHNTLAYAASPVKTDFSNDYNATLFLRRFLQNADFKRAFITRFSDQLNTAFSTNRVVQRLAQWEAAYAPEMTEHVHRWRQPYNWANDMARLRSYAQQRTGAVWGHLQSFFTLSNRVSVTVNVNDTNLGHVRLNSIDITPGYPGVGDPAYPWTGNYFPEYPVVVTAVPSNGARFVAWVNAASNTVSINATYSFAPAGAPALTAVFASGAAPALLHYWNFNNVAQLLTPTFTVGGAAMAFDLLAPAAITNGTLQDFAAANARFGDPAGDHLRVNNPTGATMRVSLPSTGYEDIIVKFETRRSGSGAGLQVIDITTDGVTYSNLMTNVVFDAAPVVTTLDFSSLSAADNNPNLAIRITFLVGGGGTAGNNRFDNFTADGVVRSGINSPPEVANPVPFQETREDAGALPVDLAAVFSDPDNDPLLFTALSDNTNVVTAGVAGSLLTLQPRSRGDAVVQIRADDGTNPPAASSFRVLVYPEAHALSNAPYAFTAWDPALPTGTFPTNMLFLQSNINDPALAAPLEYAYRIPLADASVPADADFPYAASSRTRINGLTNNGIAFINTGRGRDLGAALLALDTRNLEATPKVSWLSGTLIPNVRIYAIRLQYRVGLTGSFTDVLDGSGNPVEYLRNATAGHTQTFDPVALPAPALNQPYVQLLWRYHYLSGTSGARAQLRLDDLNVSAEPTPFNAWRADNFTPAELLDEAISGPLADPASTGLPNLLRFAFGLDRDDPFEGVLPRSGFAGVPGSIEVQYIYRRRIDPASGLEYRIESNDDLLLPASWRAALVGADIESLGTALPTGDGITEEVTVPVFEDTVEPSRFLRLRVFLEE